MLYFSCFYEQMRATDELVVDISFVCLQEVPGTAELKTISTLWGIILSHMCWGTSGPPPPPIRQPIGVPVTGALKWGGSGKGTPTTPAPPPPPSARKPFSSNP